LKIARNGKRQHRKAKEEEVKGGTKGKGRENKR
jgi:hypothetical protein